MGTMNEKTEIDRPEKKVTLLDRKLAIPMFIVGLSFLLLLGSFLHLAIGNYSDWLAISLLSGMGICYVLCGLEWLAHWRSGAKQLNQHWYYIILPFLRICPRDHDDGDRVWVPFVGWRRRTERLEKYLTRLFGGPMIIIALLVLPVVGLEFCLPKQIEARPWLQIALAISSALIWVAFVFEFVVMISVVKKKLVYCRKNWIDLAIVLLPLVSFIGAARLGRLMRLKQLTRTAKIYRMRGLALRSWRAIVALEVIDKLLRRDPVKVEERLLDQIKEKEREIEQLRSQLESVRERINAQHETVPEPKRSFTSSNRESAESS